MRVVPRHGSTCCGSDCRETFSLEILGFSTEQPLSLTILLSFATAADRRGAESTASLMAYAQRNKYDALFFRRVSVVVVFSGSVRYIIASVHRQRLLDDARIDLFMLFFAGLTCPVLFLVRDSRRCVMTKRRFEQKPHHNRDGPLWFLRHAGWSPSETKSRRISLVFEGGYLP